MNIGYILRAYGVQTEVVDIESAASLFSSNVLLVRNCESQLKAEGSWNEACMRQACLGEDRI